MISAKVALLKADRRVAALEEELQRCEAAYHTDALEEINRREAYLAAHEQGS